MDDIVSIVKNKFQDSILGIQETRDKFPTLWVESDRIVKVLDFLKNEAEQPYKMLYDLTAIDEQARVHRKDQPESRFTIVYLLLSFERNDFIRLKVPLTSAEPELGTITSVWPMANWYEREVYDMFGVKFKGHPHLKRLLMPQWWEGHPLLKSHPARATEIEPFKLSESKEEIEQRALKFKPEEWGLDKTLEEDDLMFLNLGPQHPGTHGILRFVLQLGR